MGDLLFVAIVIGFFAICVAYVKACDHIIGPDPDLTDVERGPGSATSEAPVADGSPVTTAGVDR